MVIYNVSEMFVFMWVFFGGAQRLETRSMFSLLLWLVIMLCDVTLVTTVTPHLYRVHPVVCTCYVPALWIHNIQLTVVSGRSSLHTHTHTVICIYPRSQVAMHIPGWLACVRAVLLLRWHTLWRQQCTSCHVVTFSQCAPAAAILLSVRHFFPWLQYGG